MGLPEITVTFKKLAETASRRSARGFLCIILRDTTSGVTWSTKTYRWLEDVKVADYSAANYKILKRAFDANPVRVTVVRLGATGTVEDAKPLLKSVAFNWICAPYANMQEDLADYIKEVNIPQRIRKAKALVYQVAADDIHIVSVPNPSVTLAGESATTPMVEYLPRLAGILAACPMTESVTNYPLTDLSAVADYTVSSSVVEPGDAVDDLEQVLAGDPYALEVAQKEGCILVVEAGHIGAAQYDVKRCPYIVGHLEDLQESGRLAAVFAFAQQIVYRDAQQVRQPGKQGDIRVGQVPLPF